MKLLTHTFPIIESGLLTEMYKTLIDCSKAGQSKNIWHAGSVRDSGRVCLQREDEQGKGSEAAVHAIQPVRHSARLTRKLAMGRAPHLPE